MTGIYWNIGNSTKIDEITDAFSIDHNLNYEFYYRKAYVSLGLMYVLQKSDQQL